MEEKVEKNIASKTIIVTGGSKGIGAEIVRTLANNGYNVVLNYNKSEKEALKIKEELNNKIEIFKADISNKYQVKKLIEFTINKFKNIDILINNAGISTKNLFTDISEEEWNNIINVNLNSVFYCCQEVIPIMVHNKNGCIINISSIWGITGASCEVAYSTSKAAVNGFTKALAKELGPSNIRVNAIAPGIINTDMNKCLNKSEINEIISEIPLERIGKTRDIAKCVEWLIEDEYTTGQIISINGGWIC